MTIKDRRTKQIPAVEGLFRWPSDSPALIGGRCKLCGNYFFPKALPFHKPDCEGDVEEIFLSRSGKLQSFTVQHYPAPPPFLYNEPFEPYGIGTVELPEGICIPGMLTGVDVKNIRVGMAAKLVIEKLYEESDGTEIMTWKFALQDD